MRHGGCLHDRLRVRCRHLDEHLFHDKLNYLHDDEHNHDEQHQHYDHEHHNQLDNDDGAEALPRGPDRDLHRRHGL